MHPVEEIRGDYVGRDYGRQGCCVVFEGVYDSVVKVVVSHGFDDRFVENQT